MSQTVAQNQRVAPTQSAIDVQLCKVFKVFGSDTAVRGVDLNICRGEFFSILGPSGCGKTTTLRLIAGFEEPTAGNIFIRGQSMAYVPPYRRPVNTVFQSYALFNHMTVWDNIAFGLRIQRQSRAIVHDRVSEALRLVKMEAFARRYPTQLSGGQQQRVALARALVNRPAVVLLDEPLGALDLKLRKEMQVELSTLHQQLGVTFVMVTHDQEEALSLSDRIAVMHEGQIEQIGTPSEIYDYPQTPFVADFIGDTNLFRGRIEPLDYAPQPPSPIPGYDSTRKVVTEQGMTIFVRSPDAWNSSEPPRQVVVSIRPEKIQVSLGQPEAAVNCFAGRLKNVMYLGTHVHYLVELQSGDQLKIMQPSQPSDRPDLHTPIYAYWNEADCLVLAA
ncbi:MAG: ABC transporter ATP-binding protein [Synechococcales bacterium]|nr:ABC transporter ATP-binding protein [Synechococcales bacterium]